MEDSKTLIKIELQKWLDEEVVLIKQKYNQNNLKASGKFERTLDSFVVDQTNLKGIIEGESYIHQLDKGRNAGKFPPLEAIKQWIKDKGIIADKISNDSLAYLIGRKIQKEGIKVPNLYNPGNLIDSTITDQKIEELLINVGGIVLKDSVNKIKESLK